MNRLHNEKRIGSCHSGKELSLPVELPDEMTNANSTEINVPQKDKTKRGLSEERVTGNPQPRNTNVEVSFA